MFARLISLLGVLAACAVFGVYAAYTAGLLYFNHFEFFFTPASPSAETSVSRIALTVSPRTVQEIDQQLWPQEVRKYHPIENLNIDGKDYRASLKVRGWERHTWQAMESGRNHPKAKYSHS